jgi:hypothetical protein
VRIFRIFRKNDAADDTKNDPVFDLTFDPKKHPTLRNVRSYLEKDIWIPVRDFVFTVQPIPPLAPANPPASVDTEQEFLLNLALPLPKDVKPVTALKAGGPPGAPVRLTTERTGIKGTQPRGEQWRVKPLGPVLEDPATYRISVTYAPGVSPSPLDLKITPHIAITKAAGQADFVATEAAPCQLAIAGGAGPYVVSTEGFPAGCEAKLNGDAGITVTVKNLQATTKGVVVVTDHEQKKGRRTVTLKK